jgi:hypothetical protein
MNKLLNVGVINYQNYHYYKKLFSFLHNIIILCKKLCFIFLSKQTKERFVEFLESNIFNKYKNHLIILNFKNF